MKNQLLSKFLILALLSISIQFISPLSLFAQNLKTIAILPFEMISSDNLSYIQTGTLQMFRSRLLWENHIQLVDKNKLQMHLDNTKQKNPDQIIKKIADLTECDFILTGSITHFANAFSIDTKVYDIKNKKYLTFSEQSKAIDDVIPKVNLIAAKINKKVFDRETVIYENMVKKEKEKAEQFKRQNPENLIPSIPQGDQTEKTPIWKIWKYL